jgi:heptaprenyl diphosphate synthase
MGAALEIAAADLERVEQLMVEVSAGSTEFLTESTTYLTRAGGKRLRPALMALVSRLGTGPNWKIHMTAAAIEMTHLATLYHDDVIDEAELRRGVPSANEKWGNKVAILAGDFLFARASGLAADVGGSVPRILADAIAHVVEGQVRELRATYDPLRSLENYNKTIEGKTASLLRASTQLGALLGDCPAPLVASLAAFGEDFGFAFQVADDLLDLAASEEELGKPPGTDLLDGVYTLPVILAVEADPSLAAVLGTPEVDVEAVRAAVLATGAFDRALEAAATHIDRALEALAAAPESPARESLTKLTRLIIDRVPVLE